MRLIIIVLICCLGRLSAQLSRADPFLDEAKMRHVKMLVDLSYDDSRPADAKELELMEKIREAKELRRLQAIQTEPNLGPYLIALAGKISMEKSGGLTGVLQAMAMRKDIDAEVIQLYTQKAADLVKKNPKNLTGYEYDLLLGVPDLLKLHASAENEDALVGILKLGEKMNDIGLAFSVARALAKIGTNRSQLPFEEALEWLRLLRSSPDDAGLLVEFRGYLLEMIDRIKSSKNAESNMNGASPATRGKQVVTVDARVQQATLWMASLGIIFCFFLVIVFLRIRKPGK